MRCLKGKDNVGGEGATQMERSVAKCTYRSSALRLFPAFLDFETHGLSAGQGICKAVGEALPRQYYLLWKWHACLRTLHEADGFFYFPCGLKMKWTFNGTGWGIPQSITTLVQGQRYGTPQLLKEFVTPKFRLAVGWGSEWMKLLLCCLKLLSSQAPAICSENWEEGKEHISAFDPTW